MKEQEAEEEEEADTEAGSKRNKWQKNIARM